MSTDLIVALMECFLLSIAENNIWLHNCLWASSSDGITVIWMRRNGEGVRISFGQENRT